MSVTDIWPATRVCSRGLYHVLTLLASILVAGSSGLCVAGALDRIALYIGNDDHIPLDLARLIHRRLVKRLASVA
jgi:hypothetical protein